MEAMVKGVDIKINFDNLDIDIYKRPTIEISRRMRRTSFQARLGRKLDNINRKVIDNNLRLASHPTDMIRIKAIRDERSQDLISRRIEDNEILPIILPTMKDVPLRKLTREGLGDVLIPDFYPLQDSEVFDIYAPVEVQLDEDDLLIRLIYVPNVEDPWVICLQIKDNLATVGYNSVIWMHYRCTIYDEKLPDYIVDIIKDANEKREILGW